MAFKDVSTNIPLIFPINNTITKQDIFGQNHEPSGIHIPVNNLFGILEFVFKSDIKCWEDTFTWNIITYDHMIVPKFSLL